MNYNVNSKLFSWLLITSVLCAFPSDKKSDLDKTIHKKVKPTESRVIICNGATLIIKSNDHTKARVLANKIKANKGGTIRELHNGEQTNSNYKTRSEQAGTGNENEVLLPLKFTVEQAYPNPFNPVVNVRFGLPKEVPVHILIYDLAGRLIGDYHVGIRSAGWHEFSWNATDMLGQDIGTGIYLLTIQAGDKLQKQKITYIK